MVAIEKQAGVIPGLLFLGGGLLKKIYRDERGNAMLEFVMIFPLFIGLILGTINVAVLLNNDILASSAARVAGRTAAVTGNRLDGENRGKELFRKAGLVQLDGQVRITGKDYVTAEVTYQVPVLVPGFACLFGGKPWDDEIKLKKRNSYYVEYRHR
ncbi:MAG: hypothetical protein VR67_17460 [Peptococcaceae bacterium BRH_c8a]|nr:MAG: hypothetical protein VR67_17460 [Peptococcaceae bacterium BRH_c8a]